MKKSTMSHDEKRAITSARQNAVRNAWKMEAARVANGEGTRQWTVAEQKELLETGEVKGYQGHHMKSVSEYPEFAGDPENIQFLTNDEHLLLAHNGSYHNATNGYLNPKTGQMEDFRDNDLPRAPVSQLNETYIDLGAIHAEAMKGEQNNADLQAGKGTGVTNDGITNAPSPGHAGGGGKTGGTGAAKSGVSNDGIGGGNTGNGLVSTEGEAAANDSDMKGMSNNDSGASNEAGGLDVGSGQNNDGGGMDNDGGGMDMD